MKFHAVVIAACMAACSSNSTKQPKAPVSAAPITEAKTKEPTESIEPIYLATDSVCPSDMTHISGMFCTNVIQNCIKYLDPPGTKFARCQEFAPSICTGEKVHMDFCIDTEEHHPPNSDITSSDMTFGMAAEECVQEGKQLCQENQWTLACEGEEMLPHTTGYTRPSDKCNFDKTHLVVHGKFVNQSMSINDNPQCVSPYGVHNMNGNVDEWVITEHPYTVKGVAPMSSGLKGGWWGGMRDRCRPMTTGHGGGYHDIQIGYRCCKGT